MSTYYEFYIGVNKGDKVEVIGPFTRKDGEYKRHRSSQGVEAL